MLIIPRQQVSMPTVANTREAYCEDVDADRTIDHIALIGHFLPRAQPLRLDYLPAHCTVTETHLSGS